MGRELKNKSLDDSEVITYIGSYLGKSFYVSMGRFLIENRKGMVVLHKNKNKFDFKKSNLIVKDLSYKKIREGKYNFNGKIPTSKYKGVYKKKKETPGYIKVWAAQIRKNKKLIYIGNFYTEKEAVLAYNEKAKELYGEFAYQNKI